MTEHNKDIIRIILAVLLPPLGVAMQVGVNNKHFWINIALTVLGYLPGVIHAVYIIANVDGSDMRVAGPRL